MIVAFFKVIEHLFAKSLRLKSMSTLLVYCFSRGLIVWIQHESKAVKLGIIFLKNKEIFKETLVVLKAKLKTTQFTFTIASIIHNGMTLERISCSLSLARSLTSVRCKVRPATSLKMMGVCSGMLNLSRPGLVCSSSLVLKAVLLLLLLLLTLLEYMTVSQV